MFGWGAEVYGTFRWARPYGDDRRESREEQGKGSGAQARRERCGTHAGGSLVTVASTMVAGWGVR